MNNIYNPGEVYTLHNDMCYENKVMVGSIPDQLPQHSIRISADHEKSEASAAAAATASNWKRWLSKRKRCPFPVIANVVIVISVLVVLLCIEFGIIPQRKLGFICKDPKISFPYTGDTVTPAMLLVVCYFGPLTLIVFIELLREKSLKNICPGIVWTYYKEMLIGGHFVLLLTELTKVMVGEHRPHFFDVCQPDMNLNCVPGSYVEDYTCTNKAFGRFFITDSSRSFPSGHASISVFISIFCAYVIQTRLPVALTGRLMRPLLIVVCLSWGIICSVSRITDRRHHWWDVLTGVVIGALGVIFYLALFHPQIRNALQKASETSISSTMLLDVKNKDATSVRV